MSLWKQTPSLKLTCRRVLWGLWMPAVCGEEVFIPVNAWSGPVHTSWVSGKVSPGTLRRRAGFSRTTLPQSTAGPTTDKPRCLGQLAWMFLHLGFPISKVVKESESVHRSVMSDSL